MEQKNHSLTEEQKIEFAERYEKERLEELYQEYKRQKQEADNSAEEKHSDELPAPEEDEEKRGFKWPSKMSNKSRNSIIVILIFVLLSPLVKTYQKIKEKKESTKATVEQMREEKELREELMEAFLEWADTSLIKPCDTVALADVRVEAGCLSLVSKDYLRWQSQKAMYEEVLSVADSDVKYIQGILNMENKRLKTLSETDMDRAIKKEKVELLSSLVSMRGQEEAVKKDISKRLDAVEESIASIQEEEGVISAFNIVIEEKGYRLVFVSPKKHIKNLSLLNIKELSVTHE